jgi:hypothetical protein
MTFFPRPRREPDEEAAIRALFAQDGVLPHVDYLSNHGRTRIIEFRIPDDLDSIVALCERVLREVYSIRPHDTLKFSFLLSNESAGVN